MALGFSTGSLSLNIKIGVGMFAQVVNFSMTILYFFTAYPSRMKNQMQVEALQSQLERKMQQEFVRTEQMMEQCNSKLGTQMFVDIEGARPQDQELFNAVEECRAKLIRD